MTPSMCNKYPHYAGDVINSSVPGKQFLTVREPVGVAAMVCPWNFPIGMPARKISAALAAGCTCVVKPAEDTPLSTLALAAIIQEAGLPAGLAPPGLALQAGLPAGLAPPGLALQAGLPSPTAH